MNQRAEQINLQGTKYLNAKNYESAFRYFCEAQRLGSDNGAFNVGYCLLNGFGCNKDFAGALKYFKYVCENVNDNPQLVTNAQYFCGVIFYDGGYGVAKNMYVAEEYFRKASAAGHTWSMFMLASCYTLSDRKNESIPILEQVLITETKDYTLRNKASALPKRNKLSEPGIC